jgi:sulfide:quinone oxidoreductase
MKQPQITIIGSGFAALTAVREVRRLAPESVISLIARQPEMIYLPSLIWIPSGIRQAKDLRIPLDNFFRRMRVNYIQGEAAGLKPDGRQLVLANGQELSNDGLIIASGGRFIKKLPGIEHAITPCEGIAAAEKIRDRLAEMSGGTIAIGFATNPNEPSAMRGGPMFEFLFGIDRQLRREGRRDRFKLIFFNPSAEPGQRLGPKAVKGLLAMMAKRNIETHLGHKLRGFGADKVMTEGGEFAADLILFMPGMTGNPWFDQTGLPRSPGGLITADRQCRVAGMSATYVAGDAGSFPGPDWMPKQAHMADIQAKVAASNLIAELRGDKGSEEIKVELMCIVDSLDQGMLVTRNERGGVMLPPLRAMHWAKRFFEQWYLRQYR